eukprot:gene20893-22944_t
MVDTEDMYTDTEEDNEDDQKLSDSQPIPNQFDSCPLQHFFGSALEMRKLLGESKGFSNEPLVDMKVNVSKDDESKLISITQDLIYAESKGKKQTEKALALGMAVRQITGSIRLLRIIHGLGHSVSPSTVYRHDSALALASTNQQDIVIPRNINTETFATIVWDNNDFSEETVSGKGTTHVANVTMIQKGSNLLKEKVLVSKRIRTVKAPDTNIAPYICREKGTLSFQSNICNISLDTQDHLFVQSFPRKVDFSYAVLKLFSSDNSFWLPGWTGFNTKLCNEVPSISKIGYLPVIDAPVTDLTTVNTILGHSVSICRRLQLPEIVLVFNEAIYAKAQMIRWKEKEY